MSLFVKTNLGKLIIQVPYQQPTQGDVDFLLIQVVNPATDCLLVQDVGDYSPSTAPIALRWCRKHRTFLYSTLFVSNVHHCTCSSTQSSSLHSTAQGTDGKPTLLCLFLKIAVNITNYLFCLARKALTAGELLSLDIIMFVLCTVLSRTCYAHFNARIIGAALPRVPI